MIDPAVLAALDKFGFSVMIGMTFLFAIVIPTFNWMRKQVEKAGEDMKSVVTDMQEMNKHSIQAINDVTSAFKEHITSTNVRDQQIINSQQQITEQLNILAKGQDCILLELKNGRRK